jgi:hypothetical protein
MAISASTFISDTIKFVRDRLDANITDPISAARVGRERFVMTSYPMRGTKYPIITVREAGISQNSQLGMQSEATYINFPIEIRIWARNEKEKDFLSQEVYEYLRTNQLAGSNGNVEEGLFDFDLTNSVNVDEDGDNAIKSRVMTFAFNEIITG